MSINYDEIITMGQYKENNDREAEGQEADSLIEQVPHTNVRLAGGRKSRKHSTLRVTNQAAAWTKIAAEIATAAYAIRENEAIEVQPKHRGIFPQRRSGNEYSRRGCVLPKWEKLLQQHPQKETR